ncbi:MULTISPECIES: MFS transporter [Lonsdalea]|nr:MULTISPECIES: MFS transporter [Lonsdalea]QPQ24897.1 MFS transporter [Lonsdalea populi]
MLISPMLRLGRPFFLLLLAENSFITGANIASFSIGAWVYRQTGSLFDFSLVSTIGAFSTLAVLPFSGALADRADRRKAILLSDAGVFCLLALLLIVMEKKGVALWPLYVFTVVMALAQALRTPAYRTTMSALLRSEQMPLACGLMGVVTGAVGIVVPVIAGMLMYRYSLDGIFIFNLITLLCSLALAALGFYRLPASIRKSPGLAGYTGGWLRDILRALAYFNQHRTMAMLLVYILIQNGLEALVSTLVIPLILTHYSVRELGVIMAWGGLGAALGALPLFVPWLSSRLSLLLLSCNLLLSLCVAIVSVVNSVFDYAVCVFIALFVGSLSTVCALALWMRKVPLNHQGSVFALMGSLTMLTLPVAVLFAGSAVDRWIVPAFTSGASWTHGVSYWLGGADDGGAIRVVLLCCGLAGTMLSLLGLTHREMRDLDGKIPDGR